MRVIDSIKERMEQRRLRIASPYLDHSLGSQRESLLKFFQSSRELDRLNLVKRIESIKVPLPWPEGTPNDKVWELAIDQVLTIVNHELRSK